MRLLQGLGSALEVVDGAAQAKAKAEISKGFREQLEFAIPSNEAEDTLRELAAQLQKGKVRVKAFLRYPLHAKLY
jgi:S1-C subfamily serine protease